MPRHGSDVISPDKAMDRPIDRLLFWTWRFLKRTNDVSLLTEEEAAALGDEYFEREEDIRHSYAVVLRLRAAEVVAHLDSVGLRATVEQVKRNPFLVALAYAHHCGLTEEA